MSNKLLKGLVEQEALVLYKRHREVCGGRQLPYHCPISWIQIQLTHLLHEKGIEPAKRIGNARSYSGTGLVDND
ncbi:hypothetical protein GQ457_05G005830 [Hibiscus cannabinus]